LKIAKEFIEIYWPLSNLFGELGLAKEAIQTLFMLLRVIYQDFGFFKGMLDP